MSTKRRAYPYAISMLERNWQAGALQWQAAITGATYEDVLRRCSEDLALHLFYAELDGERVPAPLPLEKLDLSGYEQDAAEGLDYDVVYVEPARLSEPAVAIQRVMQAKGITKKELARRMGVTPSAVSRITDLLYFGHSTATLHKVVAALQEDLTVRYLIDGDHPQPQVVESDRR